MAEYHCRSSSLSLFLSLSSYGCMPFRCPSLIIIKLQLQTIIYPLNSYSRLSAFYAMWKSHLNYIMKPFPRWPVQPVYRTPRHPTQNPTELSIRLMWCLRHFRPVPRLPPFFFGQSGRRQLHHFNEPSSFLI